MSGSVRDSSGQITPIASFGQGAPSPPSTPRGNNKDNLVVAAVKRISAGRKSALQAPNLDNIIRNMLKPPLALDDFREFMAMKHAEENIDFLVREDSFESNERATLQDIEAIVREFIRVGADKEINISHSMKVALLQKADEVQQQAIVDRALFVPAKTEIKTIVNNGPFIAFMKEKTTTNLNKAHVDKRYRVSAISFFLVFLPLFGALIACQMLNVPYMNNRWWRIILFIPILIFVSFFLSAYRKL